MEAQRAAVEKGKSIESVSNINEFYAKAGNGSLDLETIKAALSSKNAGLKRAALRNAPLDDTLAKMFISNGKITIREPRVLLDLLLAFASPRDLVVIVRLPVLLHRLEEFPGLHDASPPEFLG